MLGGLGAFELLIVSFILVSIFGTKKVKDLARGLGESQKELRKIKKEYERAVSEIDEDVSEKKAS